MMDEVAVPAQVYAWTDKYRPRKPRYFNRVKTVRRDDPVCC